MVQRSPVQIILFSASVVEVFEATNVPVKFDVLKNFTFENISQRETLQKN